MKQFGNTHKEYNDAPMSEFPLLSKLFLRIVVVVLWVLTKILCPWKIENKDELYRKRADGKGAVLIMNHVSVIEPVLVVVSYVLNGHYIRPIYKSEYDENSFMSWFLTQVGGIPVKRGSADMHAIRCAQHALERGESILIYPEGTRIRSDAEPVEIHGGFALIANMADADILPSAVVGALNIKPEGKVLPRPSRIWIRVGKALRVGEVDRKSRKARLAEVESEAMAAVYAIRDELRREHPGKI